ncbi:RDD family protein [Rivibacter subsaxonicus]|uniref:Putative RDD family membrane protein YckC n=1 Tax=Rivibacter subsaxonicus TaxID=457575 RepID=A0A4Q7W2V0_9BURK|nr:RDD family protein [Rivibacter subsaxonicus]RZU03079.1 putative RDD family membrane protein YckC [Rivibacter subsaxonicus]
MNQHQPLPPTPSLRRRMAAFVYEGVLLFGVVMIAGYLFGTLTQQRHALQGRHEFQAFLFVVVGIYFGWFWSHSGQTLAMKTWQVRLVARDGGPVSQARALLRYVAAWIWFLPALAIAWLAGWHGGAPLWLTLLGGILVYALASFAHPQRQFWHDELCGTRLVRAIPTNEPR